MILYHGGTLTVEFPEIRLSDRTLDFGVGFYTTSSFSQAAMWAKRKARLQNCIHSIVSAYYFPDDLSMFPQLSCLSFPNVCREWLEFVLDNRIRNVSQHNYDLVREPVANDRVYACLNAFETGFWDEAKVLSELKSYTFFDQIAFNSEYGIAFLTFIESREIVS